jgi:hypothetical protein
LVVAALAELAWFGLRPGKPEPVFQGKPARFWIDDLARAASNQEVAATWEQFGPAAVPVLAKALGKGNDPLQRLYGRIWPQLPKFLPRRLAQPVNCVSIRQKAAALLGVVPYDITPAIPALLRAINDEDPGVRMNAANPLGKIGETHREVLPVLLRAMRNKDRMVRGNIVVSLGRFQRPSDAIPPLLKALEDPDASVRVRAVNSLRRIAPETEAKLDMVTLPLRCANDPDWRARIYAVEALGHSGNRARAAVPVLQRLLQDGDASIRRAATNALKQIDPEAAAKAGVR